MRWDSLSDFLAMGGQGLYVWGAVVMVAAALLWEVVMLSHKRAAALDALREQAALRSGPP